MESTQHPTYFFFIGLYPEIPRPSNGWPANSPLNSETSQSPLPRSLLVSTPFEDIVCPPGSMLVSTVASQTPTSFFKISCSGPGCGIWNAGASAGGFAGFSSFFTACAATPPSSAATINAAVHATIFTGFIDDLLFVGGKSAWNRSLLRARDLRVRSYPGQIANATSSCAEVFDFQSGPTLLY